jgi:phosphohistidine phosphatase
MPRLVLVRHAKSGYPDDTDDFDRPLALRGFREAPLAGVWLKQHLAGLDRVTVSAALRTLQTWELIDTELAFDGPLTIDPRVYEAAPTTLLEIVREQPDTAETVLLLGHNPGLAQLVMMLSSDGNAESVRAVEEKFPTSAIAVLSFEGSWRDLAPGTANLDEFAVAR